MSGGQSIGLRAGLEPAAKNGLFDRRAFLRAGTALSTTVSAALVAGRGHAQPATHFPEIRVFWPSFSLAERDRRWAVVRKNMADPQWDLDAIITCYSDEWGCDARYLTQIAKVRYSGGGPQVIFPRDPNRTVWVQMGGARHRDEWIGRLNDGGDWLSDGRMVVLAEYEATEMARRLADEGFDRRGTRIGVSMLKGSRFETDGLVSATWLDTVRRALPRTEFVAIDQWGPDAGPIISATMTKSDEELAMIRHAVASNQAALSAMVEATAAGASCQAQLWWAANATMFALNGEDFNRLSVGLDEGGNMTLGEPVRDAIAMGQLCTQEIASSYQGYACQINHTFFIGDRSTPGYAYYDAAIEVLTEIHAATVAFVKPDVTTYGDLMRHLDSLYRRYDVEGGSVALHTGGIGRVRPRLGSGPDGEIVIRSGHAFDWKPSVTLSSAKARDAAKVNRDVQLGESYFVTPAGMKRLGDRPLEPIATHA